MARIRTKALERHVATLQEKVADLNRALAEAVRTGLHVETRLQKRGLYRAVVVRGFLPIEPED